MKDRPPCPTSGNPTNRPWADDHKCSGCWRAEMPLPVVLTIDEEHLDPHSREALAETFRRIGEQTDARIAAARATGHQEAADAMEIQRRPRGRQGVLPL